MGAADVIGVLGFAVAALSLGWQITAWFMSAGRARCVLASAVGIDDDAVERAIGTRVEGFKSFIGVEVHNIGRSPLVVRNYGYGLIPQRRLFGRSAPWTFGWDIGPALPHTIPPGDAALWWTPTEIVRSRLPDGSVIQMRIVTAHGRVVRSKNSYTL